MSRIKGVYDKLGKKWFFTTLILLMVIIIFLVIKFYLYLNLIIGNDTVVKLEASTQFLSLKHQESSTVQYETSITANPFCKTACHATFQDISSGIIINASEFTLKPGTPIKDQYTITAPEKGVGSKLYRFTLKCSSYRTLLCQTEEQQSTRSFLLILEYNLTEGELLQYRELAQKVNQSLQELNQVEAQLLAIENSTAQLSKYTYMEPLIQREEEIRNQTFNLRLSLLKLVSPDNTENPELLLTSYASLPKTANLNKELLELENTLSQDIQEYNLIIKALSEERAGLLNLGEFTNQSELNQSANLFNAVLEFFSEKNTLTEKASRVESLKASISSISMTNQSGQTSQSISLMEITSSPISIIKQEPAPLAITFEEKSKTCCLFGACQACMAASPRKNYPIIILHGHAISESNSAEYSLEGFNMLQEALEKEGYINAGTITLYTPKDIPASSLGYFPAPFSFRASYYFDVFKEPDNYRVIQTKSENIDTHSIRLKELIDMVKYKTGKQKVKVIAFSMGGLVARRYIQVFGSEDIDRLILLGTPNKGITGEVSTLCPVTGGRLECRDMDKASLFMNKLNDNQPYSIPVYNIIGTGCFMLDGSGDGAVLEENARLEHAENFIINGACRSRFAPLHLDLLNIGMYPEVYARINSSLMA